MCFGMQMAISHQLRPYRCAIIIAVVFGILLFSYKPWSFKVWACTRLLNASELEGLKQMYREHYIWRYYKESRRTIGNRNAHENISDSQPLWRSEAIRNRIQKHELQCVRLLLTIFIPWDGVGLIQSLREVRQRNGTPSKDRPLFKPIIAAILHRPSQAGNSYWDVIELQKELSFPESTHFRLITVSC